MFYEKEIELLMGEAYDLLLSSVEDGRLDQQRGGDIASKLHSKVGGAFVHATNGGYFTFDRRAMRQILSDWYQHCVPDNPVEDLIAILRHEDIQMNSLAKEMELCETSRKAPIRTAATVAMNGKENGRQNNYKRKR